MPATVRLGTCSFADEGLLKAWYPRGVSTAAARLGYYAEHFDTVEVDSPYYHLPDPAVRDAGPSAGPSSRSTKAHASMTWHDGEPTDRRSPSSGPARAARALGQAPWGSPAVPPAFHEVAGREAELERAPAAGAVVPLVEFRHRSWMGEREDTLAFLEERPPTSPSTRPDQPSNVVARHAETTARSRRPLPRTKREDMNIRPRSPDRSTDVRHRGARRGCRSSSACRKLPTRCTRCSTTTATTSRREAPFLRGLLTRRAFC